ncbi:hypothetical protein MNBD_CHLOROFLEXI01-130 [hydrothermal vent metagenome]|uniref:Uncharacterized protein n=1 Tax=hydrothermal vent metagenome TaxID=652676 RepID=A0A3B0UMV7_9ZZZZ
MEKIAPDVYLLDGFPKYALASRIIRHPSETTTN